MLFSKNSSSRTMIYRRKKSVKVFCLVACSMLCCWMVKTAVEKLAVTDGFTGMMTSSEKHCSNSSTSLKPTYESFLNSTVKNLIRWVKTTKNVSLNLVESVHDSRIVCNCLKSAEMIIVVHSSIGHEEQRKALRETIGKHRLSFKVNYTLMFVVGSVDSAKDQESTFEECDKHRDMLLLKTPDSYNFLSYKALGWLKFLALDCPKFKYVLKIDDDTLVNFKVLTDEIKKCEINNTTSGICVNISCCLWTDARVFRSGKVNVTFEQYHGKYWPQMCPGLAYFMPRRIVTSLWDVAGNSSFVWLDDVFVTGFLRKTANESIFPLNKYYLENYDNKYAKIKAQSKIFGHLFNHTNFLTVYPKYWNGINNL